MRIFIVGPMASGKSTIGKRLAQKLNLQFIDIDKEIESRAGTDIPWIFEVEGEKGFRKREEKVLEESIKESNIVISTGAGIVLSKRNRDLMTRSGKVIYLEASLKIQLKRTQNDKSRPLLMDENKEEVLKKLKKEREPIYEEISNLKINQENKKLKQVVEEISNKLNNK
tara:strand:+ start:1256 stop:1762 length:507 start_codon:yes stop_codon:yes gene_type:complete